MRNYTSHLAIAVGAIVLLSVTSAQAAVTISLGPTPGMS
jgi:hypothetical protein